MTDLQLPPGFVHFKAKGKHGWLAVAPNGDTKTFFTLSERREWVDRANRALDAKAAGK